MVRVAEIRVLPAECANGGIGCLPRLAGLRTDNVMFAVALVPDRRDDDSRLLCQQARLQLRVRLAPEPVAYPNRVLLKFKIFRHRQPLHSFC